MPSILGFGPGDFTFNGSSIQLDPAWDESTDAYTFSISDGDSYFQGDSDENEEGNDESQDVVVYNGSGGYVADGQVYLEEAYILNDGAGNSVTLYKIEIDGDHVGYVADGEIIPGVTYSFSTENVTSSNDPAYSDLEDPTFDPDDNNNVTGGAYADDLQLGAGDDTASGGGGADTIGGGDGDDFISGGYSTDHMDGGDGIDTVSYHDAFGGTEYVELDLEAGTGELKSSDGTSLGTETVTNFENAVGGASGDQILGTSGANTLDGADGDDFIDGRAGDDTIIGGEGSDTLTGGDGDDTFIYEVGDGADTITDFNTGNSGALDDGDNTNNDFIDLSGFYDDIWELQADYSDDGVLNQSNDGVGGADYSDNTQFGLGDSISFTGGVGDGSFFTVENTGVVCFTKGTLIQTPAGQRAIETLKPGDLVVTRDNGPQELLWVSQRTLSRRDLETQHTLKPVLIAPELIGATAPLLVSRQHGVVINLNGEELLVRAIHLAKMRGGKARIAFGCKQVSYFHLLFEKHQIIFANGAPAESYYPGRQAVGALPRDARTELARINPDLARYSAADAYGGYARNWAASAQLPDRLKALRPALH